MPVMGIKLIGQILVSVSLDGTIILWDNLRSLSEDSPPKAIHVIFNENTPSEENHKISLFKADKEGSYNKKCLDIESKAFLYALVVGYVAAIIVALASWFGGQRSELASVLSGVAAGIFFGALTGIIKYILSLRTAHDSGSDGKTVDYKNVEMAEQGKQGTPNVFESAEDGLVSPENVLGEPDQHDENAALSSVVSGSLNGSELDRGVGKGSAKGKRSLSHKDSELGNEDQNSGAEKGDAEVDEETDGKALSRVLSGASVVSKGASAVTAPVLKKAPSVATPGWWFFDDPCFPLPQFWVRFCLHCRKLEIACRHFFLYRYRESNPCQLFLHGSRCYRGKLAACCKRQFPARSGAGVYAVSPATGLHLREAAECGKPFCKADKVCRK